ncbi:enhancer binding protein-2, putative [Entamoeba histolytica HM-1:IMSS-B]|uniref:Enhancer binding protein-2, putative n=7 Tax=Entamoeba histolytica TaxID=5759 RepID=C4LV48_ENTH1|nr:enhancer binding protein-2, putative [Entamoeba histolytica HM-1:IMSS]EMD45051.1 enhancer binding protein, putative [Entamoeba histolytica KU27]EMH72312.1 enhancer binding protein-2, putative [Entamoeba histolytica HM-1:IMSS-B]EMS10736.1 enhancer binding protein-2, putative [Entamoeba histolytica HM-3:IMSS]ENY63611.1 enhancer binding protein-2, putative [Entamoeba histolytica HM-1:IMSS-A]GAT92529.1 enhancer binding protein 2 putative [Entamoeba histolytica]|eukprot:XP_649106.1 enhancer binding protein-2, putative [Entamoeba histolytica HM-1:IMSS]
MTKLYIGNLSYKTTEENLKTHFESFGKIKEAKLMIFRGYSRGFAFVEYETEEDAKKAVAANGVEFEGRKLKVEIARPPKERKEVPEGEKKTTAGPRGYRPRRFGPRRFTRKHFGKKTNGSRVNKKEKKEVPTEFSDNLIFVKNLAYAIKDEDLKEIFKEFNVVSAKVVTYNHRGNVRSKGYGFVEVKSAEDQKAAVEKLNGTTQKERAIGVFKAYKKQEQKEETPVTKA